MATKSSWAAAFVVVAGSTFIAAGCRTAPERSSASSASAEESGTAGTATATTEQPAPSTEGGQAGASPQRGSSETAQAGSTATSETAQTGSTATAYEVTGRVEKIDESNIQVAGKLLKVDSSTSVSKGGIGATLADVKEGDEVRASLSGSGDPPKAERIEVMPATEAPPATETPPPTDQPPEAADTGTTR